MANNIVMNKAKRQLMRGLLDFDSDTLKVTLVNSDATNVTDAGKRAWDSLSADIQLAGYEVTGTNAPAGGLEVSGAGIAPALGGGDTFYLSANDAQWSGVTLSAAGCVVWKSVDGGAGGDIDMPICFLDFAGNQAADNGTMNLAWNSTYGIVSLT